MDNLTALTSGPNCRASRSERWLLAERQSHLGLSGWFLLLFLSSFPNNPPGLTPKVLPNVLMVVAEEGRLDGVGEIVPGEVVLAFFAHFAQWLRYLSDKAGR